jgi:hypothetical protein
MGQMVVGQMVAEPRAFLAQKQEFRLFWFRFLQS